jgi:hypothetical protein
MRRATVALIAALGLGALALPAAHASGSTAPRANELQGCGKVQDEGRRSRVRAANLKCEKARRIASAFIQRDRVKPGWKANNPAGCEWFMYRKASADEFADWVGSGDPIGFRLIYFTKFRGCES